MFTDVRKVSGEILDLLKTRTGPVSIKEISEGSAASMSIINMSIGMLVREKLICIERKDGENIIVLVYHEASAVTR